MFHRGRIFAPSRRDISAGRGAERTSAKGTRCHAGGGREVCRLRRRDRCCHTVWMRQMDEWRASFVVAGRWRWRYAMFEARTLRGAMRPLITVTVGGDLSAGRGPAADGSCSKESRLEASRRMRRPLAWSFEGYRQMRRNGLAMRCSSSWVPVDRLYDAGQVAFRARHTEGTEKKKKRGQGRISPQQWNNAARRWPLFFPRADCPSGTAMDGNRMR